MSFRKKTGKFKSKKIWKKGLKVKSRNNAMPMRGGYRI